MTPLYAYFTGFVIGAAWVLGLMALRERRIRNAVVPALREAEAALTEGDENCGGEADNLYHEPLRKVRATLALITPGATS